MCLPPKLFSRMGWVNPWLAQAQVPRPQPHHGILLNGQEAIRNKKLLGAPGIATRSDRTLLGQRSNGRAEAEGGNVRASVYDWDTVPAPLACKMALDSQAGPMTRSNLTFLQVSYTRRA